MPKEKREKSISPKAQIEFARRVNLAQQLLALGRPLIYISTPSEINIDGVGYAPSLHSAKIGQTISFNSSLREMIKTYNEVDEMIDAKLKNIKINDVINMGRGYTAIVADGAVFCTLDIGAACRQVLYGERYKHKNQKIEPEDIRVILSKYMQEVPVKMANSDISIRHFVDQCLADSIPMIGVSGSDANAIQKVGIDGVPNDIKIKDLCEGDQIILNPQCIDQDSGENIEYTGDIVTVSNICQIGKETFVLTEAGLITDADLTYQILLSREGVECVQKEYKDLDHEDGEYVTSFDLNRC